MIKYRAFVEAMGTKDGVFLPLEISMLGLCGEARELADALAAGSKTQVLHELGDVLFYATALSIALGRPTYFDTRPMENGSMSCMIRRTGYMSEKVKKIVWHKRSELLAPLASDATVLFHALAGVAKKEGLTLNQVADANVAKLKDRWPTGFKP